MSWSFLGVIGLMLHIQYGLVYLCQLLLFLIYCDIHSLFEGLCPLGGFVFFFLRKKSHFEETVHIET